ncbi:MAG: hypothetical protein V4574_07245 [Pseudomonadota bacterium]
MMRRLASLAVAAALLAPAPAVAAICPATMREAGALTETLTKKPIVARPDTQAPKVKPPATLHGLPQSGMQWFYSYEGGGPPIFGHIPVASDSRIADYGVVTLRFLIPFDGAFDYQRALTENAGAGGKVSCTAPDACQWTITKGMDRRLRLIDLKHASDYMIVQCTYLKLTTVGMGRRAVR